MASPTLARRHIQEHAAGDVTEPHWGYADRIVPCKLDAESCEYLDVVYGAHDVGMACVGALWASFVAVALMCFLRRRFRRPHRRRESRGGILDKLRGPAVAFCRRHLLPDANHALFGRTTRFQVVTLALLVAYLVVLSFVGIRYATWRTLVSDVAGVYSTRTSLGPWSNRVGVIAFALVPLSVLLCSRESLLSLLTGVPYQKFNFLHRWVGYVVLVQSGLHAVGWSIIQTRLYQPQPSVGREWIVQPCAAWGITAMTLLTLLAVLSTRWAVRRTGYEAFRKAHYLLAVVFIGACWAHWSKLECFLVPSLLLWGIDRGARLVRTALLHYHPGARAGFRPARAVITRFPDLDDDGDVVRLDLENHQDCWAVGQHMYLCFPECSIWQSHPFTPLNAPVARDGSVRHSYVLRARSGETKKLAELAATKMSADQDSPSSTATTSVILTGPYGENLLGKIAADTNVVCVAGGTGITYVLPVLLELARRAPVPGRKMELIWVVRHLRNADWVREEMDGLREARQALNLTIRLFATRDVASPSSTSSFDGDKKETTEYCGDEKYSICEAASVDERQLSVGDIGQDWLEGDRGSRHPDLGRLVGQFVETTVSGRTLVFASGPGGMITDLRSVVAALNSPRSAWKRQERFDVNLVCDDRLLS
ncbi:hypothetical protein DCS_05776 [Drechmeria coniospora]|uniref:FAD-binding FR-type domain-containing protein n=1 Tax=Drechmeria coniospora TaxID=98403 RepID=A0A151GNV9_DRECN|nr:hypothetical protein DCS_05776 [Drechmeria coniospora]KYK58758.1 hypothetical protein DCS_05776 [Drechmeria coniospora]